MKLNIPKKKEEKIWVVNNDGSALPLSKFNEENGSDWSARPRVRASIKIKADYSEFRDW